MNWFANTFGFGGPTSAESNVLNQQWDKATQLFDTHPEVPQFEDTPNGPFKKCEKFDSDTDYYFLKLKTGRYIYLGESVEFKRLFSPEVFATYYLQFWNMLIGIDGNDVDVDGVKRFLKQFLYCKPKKDFKFAKGQFPKTINSNAEMISNPEKYAQAKKDEQDRIAKNKFLDEQRRFNAMSTQEQRNELNRQRLWREEQAKLALENPQNCLQNFANYLNSPTRLIGLNEIESMTPIYDLLVNNLGSTQGGFALGEKFRMQNILSNYTSQQIDEMRMIALQPQQKQKFIEVFCQNGLAIEIMVLANTPTDTEYHSYSNDSQQQTYDAYKANGWSALRRCLGLLEFTLMKMVKGAPMQGPVQGQGAPVPMQGPVQVQGGKSRSKSKSKSNRKKRNSHRRHSHKHHKHRTPKRR